MPSSIVHLRVCDALLDLIDEKYHVDFTVGNLAPDCGRPVPGTKSYDPPRNVTHFTDMPQRWNTRTHPERFYEDHLSKARDMRDFVFMLGYYCHLKVDNAYIDLFFQHFSSLYGEAFDLDMRRMIKQRDQNYHDAVFITEHPDFRPRVILDSIGGYPNRCLDYYSADAITERLIKVKHNELTAVPGEMPEDLTVSAEYCDGFIRECASVLHGFITDELDRTNCIKH